METVYGIVTVKSNLTCDLPVDLGTPEADKFRWDTQISPRPDNIDDETSGVLEIDIADEGVFGNYTCHAVNDVGESETGARVQLIEGGQC